MTHPPRVIVCRDCGPWPHFDGRQIYRVLMLMRTMETAIHDPKWLQVIGAARRAARRGESDQMHQTRNDLRPNTRTVAIELLNARLADVIDLALLTKQAHWNLKGPRFIAIHEMLDGFRTQIDDYVDTMAERVAQLGGTALGTTQVVARSTTLPPYPTDIYTISEHLSALIDRYGTVANAVRKAIDTADEAGDADTADIFTEASRGLDKALWFLEAHIQELD
jgi:starvation-inducible DNA-binding protein